MPHGSDADHAVRTGTVVDPSVVAADSVDTGALTTGSVVSTGVAGRACFNARIRESEAWRVASGMVPALAAATRLEYVFADDASEPVSRIMSVPAAAALIARDVAETPRADAVPDSESVIDTPVKPSVVRRSPTLIACDQPAAFVASYAGYVAFDSMIIGMPWAIAVVYGRSPGASALFDAEIETTCVSVFAAA